MVLGGQELWSHYDIWPLTLQLWPRQWSWLTYMASSNRAKAVVLVDLYSRLQQSQGSGPG